MIFNFFNLITDHYTRKHTAEEATKAAENILSTAKTVNDKENIQLIQTEIIQDYVNIEDI